MARDASVEETFRELEESIRRARRRIEELKQENESLRGKIAALQSDRARAAARVNIILDRIDSLG